MPGLIMLGNGIGGNLVTASLSSYFRRCWLHVSHQERVPPQSHKVEIQQLTLNRETHRKCAKQILSVIIKQRVKISAYIQNFKTEILGVMLRP